MLISFTWLLWDGEECHTFRVVGMTQECACTLAWSPGSFLLLPTVLPSSYIWLERPFGAHLFGIWVDYDCLTFRFFSKLIQNLDWSQDEAMHKTMFWWAGVGGRPKAWHWSSCPWTWSKVALQGWWCCLERVASTLTYPKALRYVRLLLYSWISTDGDRAALFREQT